VCSLGHVNQWIAEPAHTAEGGKHTLLNTNKHTHTRTNTNTHTRHQDNRSL
jgi:hypothetical protein